MGALGGQREGWLSLGSAGLLQDRGRCDLFSHWWSGLLSLPGSHCWALPAQGWWQQGPSGHTTTCQPCSTSSFLQENCQGTHSPGSSHRNALEQHRGF